jgi:hypothetical protein
MAVTVAGASAACAAMQASSKVGAINARRMDEAITFKYFSL